MRMTEDILPPTRAEIEEILREHDFEPSAGAAHVWQNPERTKFLSFPEGEVPEGKEATAIYGDAERGEPGKALTFRQVRAVVTQRFEIDSPELAKLALPPPKAQTGPALPAARVIIEGEIVPACPDCHVTALPHYGTCPREGQPLEWVKASGEEAKS